ncbi:Prephenate dehydratase-domain-containing protein [Massariosphaeria phaeospora]|uniref:prephenate dehydratase n=1 Tax=Massariosphaeria phaeospora TaxID=100035 RepID=A0A7C8MAP6_9PLEO|nr:Prephenate dehydratase-domain-containing protein [Massariosphaeria phaeospora]
MIEKEGDGKAVVAFLGPEASYTHQATLSAFPPSSHYTLTPFLTIAAVFSAVQSGAALRGVVPFENSSNGSVVATLDLFADIPNTCPDILVCGEAYVRVSHCLLGHAQQRKLAVNGSAKSSDAAPDISGIRTLYSHPQAWGQCTAFLAARFPDTERIDVSSTSRAAQLVAQDASGASAAVSNAAAAALFNLDVLARGIQDRQDNCTRFLVLRKRDADSDADSATQADGGGHGTVDMATEQKNQPKEPAHLKSLISFTLAQDHDHDHNADNPGALAHALAVFARHGLNLSSINTRPSGVENWNYVFFVECTGMSRGKKVGKEEEKMIEKEEKNIEDEEKKIEEEEKKIEEEEEQEEEDEKKRGGRRSAEPAAVSAALAELRGVCRGCMWLGSWRGGNMTGSAPIR